jgi:RNA polymerase sigma-70 factor (ECF subfamily)
MGNINNIFSVDRNQFITVVKDNQRLIYKICHSYCRNRENRIDLEQEILFQLWKSFEKYDGRVKISTWIYRIALNTAISFYRNDYKQKKHASNVDVSMISLVDAEYESEQDENIMMLYRFIEQLNEIDKALMLLYLDDNKYRDIAEIIGITETNVATKINRIKKSLKEQFSNH